MSAWTSLDQATTHGVHGSLGAVVNSQLVQYVSYMGLGCGQRDNQLVANFLVRESINYKLYDFKLTR
ncbi:MAG: hypothetical protein C0508_11430 [Cyanobacteria bacterium PR.023]|nr:hypothetical protein [Cyanobacteria bacterium PR.023]